MVFFVYFTLMIGADVSCDVKLFCMLVFISLHLQRACFYILAFVHNLRMHRQPDHVMAFLLAELGTSGSLDGQQRLVVKGRFAPKNFEGILRRYISKYICLVPLFLFFGFGVGGMLNIVNYEFFLCWQGK